MSVIINHNAMAANAYRNLSGTYGKLSTSVQRLSSGLRINSAADDAAGLAIREMMRADISTLQQGLRNAADGISMIQTADGGLSVIDEKLTRMKELAEQAATGTYTTVQRDIINSEYQAMAKEIDRIASSTNFNGIKLLDGSVSNQHGGQGLKIHFGVSNNAAEDYYFVNMGDARATSNTGLRVGGDAKNDIWGQGAAASGPLAGPGCCTAGFGSLNENAGFTSGQTFSFGYNWDWKEDQDSDLLSGRYLAGRYTVNSSDSLQDLVSKVNAGTQARAGIAINSNTLGAAIASGGTVAVCVGDEAYYWGSAGVATGHTAYNFTFNTGLGKMPYGQDGLNTFLASATVVSALAKAGITLPKGVDLNTFTVKGMTGTSAQALAAAQAEFTKFMSGLASVGRTFGLNIVAPGNTNINTTIAGSEIANVASVTAAATAGNFINAGGTSATADGFTLTGTGIFADDKGNWTDNSSLARALGMGELKARVDYRTGGTSGTATVSLLQGDKVVGTSNAINGGAGFMGRIATTASTMATTFMQDLQAPTQGQYKVSLSTGGPNIQFQNQGANTYLADTPATTAALSAAGLRLSNTLNMNGFSTTLTAPSQSRAVATARSAFADAVSAVTSTWSAAGLLSITTSAALTFTSATGTVGALVGGLGAALAGTNINNVASGLITGGSFTSGTGIYTDEKGNWTDSASVASLFGLKELQVNINFRGTDGTNPGSAQVSLVLDGKTISTGTAQSEGTGLVARLGGQINSLVQGLGANLNATGMNISTTAATTTATGLVAQAQGAAASTQTLREPGANTSVQVGANALTASQVNSLQNAAANATYTQSSQQVGGIIDSSKYSNTTQINNNAGNLSQAGFSASDLASAINHNANSEFWAMTETGADGKEMVYVFAKDGGVEQNSLRACEVGGRDDASRRGLNGVEFQNVESGDFNGSGTSFSLGGQNWGTMTPVQTKSNKGNEVWNVTLSGRDVGKERDLWIANMTEIKAKTPGLDDEVINGMDRDAFVEVQNAANAGWKGAEVRTQSSAQEALDALTDAIVKKDKIRADLGSLQNRLENTMTNQEIQIENLQASESRISDVDVAKEMTEFTKNNVMTQAAVSMLAQANSMSQLALSLMG